MKRTILIILTVTLISFSCSQQEPWKDLINGNLDQWEQLNGKASYEVVDGAIVGTTVLSSPNSFLCTKETYGDFILEFDVFVDPEMNSGVQIRSESYKEYMNGRVHGYQVELDPAERAWSGGIYDEARRMWLYPLDRNQEGRKAFVNNQWNHFRVEAIGNSIRTWCNGVACADLVDDMTPSGFIALQVHGIGNDSSKLGKEVVWKNIRIMTEELEKYATAYEPLIPQNSYIDNRLTELEKENGWQLLFDGMSMESWKAVRGEKIGDGWGVENGELGLNGPGGDIITRELFGDFELILDFKYYRGGNSGIKYFVNADPETGKGSSLGCEYQIIDRAHADFENPTHRIAALYDMIEAESPRNNGAGKWNRARIVVKGKHVEHWLNNQMTVQYERGTEEWRELVAGSKFKKVEGFGEASEGHILLQDHGNEVSFKNIKIRRLN